MEQLFTILNDFFLTKNVELLEIKYVIIKGFNFNVNLSFGAQMFDKIEDSI